jgi:hypothetical protein
LVDSIKIHFIYILCQPALQSARLVIAGIFMAKQPARKTFEIKPVVDPDAKVYPRSISGPFTRWRWIFVWLTQIIFYGLCWLPWHGRQAILFDIDTRKFYFSIWCFGRRTRFISCC